MADEVACERLIESLRTIVPHRDIKLMSCEDAVTSQWDREHGFSQEGKTIAHFKMRSPPHKMLNEITELVGRDKQKIYVDVTDDWISMWARIEERED